MGLRAIPMDELDEDGYPYEEETLKRADAIKVLAQHSIQPDTPMVWDPRKQEAVPGTDFDTELGVKEEYSCREVYFWLGY